MGKTKRKTRRSRRSRKMKGGDIPSFMKKLQDKSGIIEIGRGGAGIVYFDSEQPTSVFKISTKMSQCRVWNKEKAVYDDLQKYDIDEDLCKVIKMKDFILDSENKKCCLELSRVVNPLNNDADYTIQVQFGVDNLDYTNRGRGRFLGIENLIEMGLFTKETMKEYVRQLARVIGKLHYVAQNDGYDLEVFVGKEDKIMLYIADFDLSNKILTYSSDEIYQMVWCLSAVPYFPTQDQPELYEIFVQEYLAIAEASGKREIAEKVIAGY